MTPLTGRERETEQATIFALASAQGVAGVAVIRVSGPEAGTVLIQVAGGVPPARQACLRSLRDPKSGEVLDHALVLWMPGPASFTGEDVAEFHVHGSRAVIQAVLNAIGTIAGCVPAQAGEFTRRALLAGRLTLDQVEGLGDLLAAETERQRRLALSQFEGGLASRIESWSATLLHALALVEASIDFVDEDDVSQSVLDKARADVEALSILIRNELQRSNRAEMIRDGLAIAIVGPPNAGKSSLLNCIAGRDVAIVSPMAGTTRDIVEVAAELDGYRVRFIDTAGLREAENEIEAEGIRRSHAAIQGADLILAIDSDAERLIAADYAAEAPIMRVLSKVDHEIAVSTDDDLSRISVFRPDSIDMLLTRIATMVNSLAGEGDTVLTRLRHRHLAKAALVEIECALARMDWQMDSERVADDLRSSLKRLSEFSGQRGVESILDDIFCNFCIGK